MLYTWYNVLNVHPSFQSPKNNNVFFWLDLLVYLFQSVVKMNKTYTQTYKL